MDVNDTHKMTTFSHTHLSLAGYAPTHQESNRISKGSHNNRKGGVAGINQWMTFLSYSSLGAYKVSTVHRSYASAYCYKARHSVCYPFSLGNSLRIGNG